MLVDVKIISENDYLKKIHENEGLMNYYRNDFNWDNISESEKEIDDFILSFIPKKIEPGILECYFLTEGVVEPKLVSFEDGIDVADFVELGNKSPYGVADNIEQIKDYFKEEINNPNRSYVIIIAKYKNGDFDWDKCGEYIGTNKDSEIFIHFSLCQVANKIMTEDPLMKLVTTVLNKKGMSTENFDTYNIKYWRKIVKKINLALIYKVDVFTYLDDYFTKPSSERVIVKPTREIIMKLKNKLKEYGNNIR